MTSEDNALGIELFFSSKAAVAVDRNSDLYEHIPRMVGLLEARGQYPLRLDADDWLTLQDIAKRMGISREVVRLWSVGACGPGGFPPPLDPKRDTSFYSWAEVSEWIRTNTRHNPGPADEPVLVAMNLALQLRRLLPRLSRPEVVLNLIQPAAVHEVAGSGRPGASTYGPVRVA